MLYQCDQAVLLAFGFVIARATSLQSKLATECPTVYFFFYPRVWKTEWLCILTSVLVP